MSPERTVGMAWLPYCTEVNGVEDTTRTGSSFKISGSWVSVVGLSSTGQAKDSQADVHKHTRLPTHKRLHTHTHLHKGMHNKINSLKNKSKASYGTKNETKTTPGKNRARSTLWCQKKKKSSPVGLDGEGPYQLVSISTAIMYKDLHLLSNWLVI